MTQTLATDLNNDLYLTNGNITVVRDLQAVLQDCEHAAKTLLGEVVLNTNIGIPYFETVWSGVINLQQFEAALRSAFLAQDGVVEVVSILSEKVGDTLQYTAVIRTIYGGGSISG